MQESNLNNLNNDARALVKDAQNLFQSATALTGEKADELRNRGMQMLDKAMVNVHHLQDNACVVGKKMAASTEAYAKENPWQAMAAVLSLGLLAGAILLRK